MEMKRKEREMKLENKNLVQVNFYYLEADLHATKKNGARNICFILRISCKYFLFLCIPYIFEKTVYICKKTKNYDTNVMEILIFVIMINFYN